MLVIINEFGPIAKVHKACVEGPLFQLVPEKELQPRNEDNGRQCAVGRGQWGLELRPDQAVRHYRQDHTAVHRLYP